MSLNTFNSYFYNRIEGIDDVKLANDKILEEIKRDQLENVKMPNDGPPFRKCAWITPFSHIKSLYKDSIDHLLNPANTITDYLGLNIDPASPDYIFIEYPTDFKEVTNPASSSPRRKSPLHPGFEGPGSILPHGNGSLPRGRRCKTRAAPAVFAHEPPSAHDYPPER